MFRLRSVAKSAAAVARSASSRAWSRRTFSAEATAEASGSGSAAANLMAKLQTPDGKKGAAVVGGSLLASIVLYRMGKSSGDHAAAIEAAREPLTPLEALERAKAATAAEGTSAEDLSAIEAEALEVVRCVLVRWCRRVLSRALQPWRARLAETHLARFLYSYF